MVFEQHNGLLIKLSCELHGFLAVNELAPLLLWGRRVRVLKETHLELSPEQSGHGSVDNRDIQLTGLDELGDLLIVAVSLLVFSVVWNLDFVSTYKEPPPISTSVPAVRICVVTDSISIGLLSHSLK